MDGGKIGDKIVEYVGIIGEKLDLSYYEKIDAAHVQAYIHPGNKLAHACWLLKRTVLI